MKKVKFNMYQHRGDLTKIKLSGTMTVEKQDGSDAEVLSMLIDLEMAANLGATRVHLETT